MANPVLSIEALERRRRLTLRGLFICLGLPLVAWPLAMMIGDGSETRDSIAGALLLLGVFALGAAPFVLGSWRRYMTRTMLDALVAGSPGIRHLDGEQAPSAAAAALSGAAFDLGAFDGIGLSEAFTGAHIQHVLTGEAEGIPFALAQLRLYNEEGFEVFRGVLGGFLLPHARPGLTVVTRERGLLVNLISRAGSSIEPVTLEDPLFEQVFEAYGDDQVQSRTVLTASMLERLLKLDELAHAQGFHAAFNGGRLMLAFPGMRWHCGLWRLPFPLIGWLEGYREWLTGLIAMPAAIVRELELHPPSSAVAAPTPSPGRGWQLIDGSNIVMKGPLSRLVAGLGMPAIYIASGSLFGGLSLFFGHWLLAYALYEPDGWTTLRDNNLLSLFLLVLFGIAYGIYAISLGVIAISRLLWTWNAPLRSIGRAIRR